MWYVYNSEGIIMLTCTEKPDENDLASRGERLFWSEEVYHVGDLVVLDEAGQPTGAIPRDDR